MTFKRALSAFAALSLSLALAAIAEPARAAKGAAGGKKQAQPAAPAATEESTIRQRLALLSAAATEGDAARMASFWLADGTYVDEDGAETKGRQLIEERFRAARAGDNRVKVELSPATVKVLGPDAAWVEGTVSRQTSLGMEPSTRFTMLLSKSEGAWMVASATETAIANRSAGDHLDALKWLIGTWSAQRGDGQVRMTAEWAGNRAFILCKFRAESKDGVAQADSQVIGWDPTREQIVSWHFDSTGSFGYGSWSKRGKQWVIHTEGVEQSGSRTNATNIISVEDKDKFSFQSVGRTVDGVPVPDMPTLAVQRQVN